MLMADTMAIFFVILGLMLAFPGLWLLCRGLWPDMASGAAERCRKGLIKPFLIGLPITAGIIFASRLLSRRLGTVGQIGAAGIICVYMVYAHTGVSGLATFIVGDLYGTRRADTDCFGSSRHPFGNEAV